MPDSSPLVSVIVLNWNGMQFIEACLGSVLRQTYPNFELIVVDNASTDGSLELIQQQFPEVTLLPSATNTGFGGGNNLGIALSKGAYIAVLNNDAEVDPGWLQEMVTAAESDPQVGMCAPKILSMADRRTIDSVGGLLIYADGIGRGRGRLEPDNGQYDRLPDILVPSGCSALYRRTMLDAVGLFDEEFFAYCEDTDLGLRCRLAGWKAISVPTAVVYHHYSGSAGKYSSTKAFLVERNRIWVMVKNYPVRWMLRSLPSTLWRYVYQVYSVLAGKGSAGSFEGTKFELFMILLRAYAAALRGLPRMLAKRRAIQATRRVSDEEIAGWFRAFGLDVAELVLKQ